MRSMVVSILGHHCISRAQSTVSRQDVLSECAVCPLAIMRSSKMVLVCGPEQEEAGTLYVILSTWKFIIMFSTPCSAVLRLEVV